MLYTAGPYFVCADDTRLYLIMDPTEIAQLIKVGFADAVVKVESDDNTHFGALVVAAEFNGKAGKLS